MNFVLLSLLRLLLLLSSLLLLSLLLLLLLFGHLGGTENEFFLDQMRHKHLRFHDAYLLKQ